jgi:hypothetical protein
MTMVFGWILKRLGHETQTTGLWGYLASRDRNKSRVEYEKARIAATKELIDHLPNGAVYREGTPEGWREIQMPLVPEPPLFVVPIERRESDKKLRGRHNCCSR